MFATPRLSPATHVKGTATKQHTIIPNELNRTQLFRCCANVSFSLSTYLALQATRHVEFHSPSMRYLSFLFVCPSLPSFLSVCTSCPPSRFSRLPLTIGTHSLRVRTLSRLSRTKLSFSAILRLSAFLALPATRHLYCCSPSRRCSSSLSLLLPFPPFSSPCVPCPPSRFSRPPPALSAQSPRNASPSPTFSFRWCFGNASLVVRNERNRTDEKLSQLPNSETQIFVCAIFKNDNFLGRN